jgi:hypothetical protein
MLHPPGGTQQRPPAPPYAGFGVLKANRSEPLTETPASLLSSIAEAAAGEPTPSSAETATALVEAANARDKAPDSTNATATIAGNAEPSVPAASEEASTEVTPSADEAISKPASDTTTTDAAVSEDTYRRREKTPQSTNMRPKVYVGLTNRNLDERCESLQAEAVA